MSDQQKQQQFNDAKEKDIRSIGGSEWSVEEEENIVGHGNAKQKEEESHPNLKIVLLEVNILWRRELEGIRENIQLNDASFLGQKSNIGRQIGNFGKQAGKHGIEGPNSGNKGGGQFESAEGGKQGN
jgi:hypothetical protein